MHWRIQDEPATLGTHGQSIDQRRQFPGCVWNVCGQAGACPADGCIGAIVASQKLPVRIAARPPLDLNESTRQQQQEYP